MKTVVIGDKFKSEETTYVVVDVNGEEIKARKEGQKGGRSKTFAKVDVLEIMETERVVKKEQVLSGTTEKTSPKRSAKPVYEPKKCDTVEEVIEEVRKLTSSIQKIALLKANMTPELKTLLKISKKSVPAVGSSAKRLIKASAKFGGEVNRNGSVSDAVLKDLEMFVETVTKDGKRFELKSEEKKILVGIVPPAKEQLWGEALGKDLKISLSDSDIDKAII